MERLFQRVDIASLVFFRIVFGILAFSEVMALWLYYHLTLRDFEPGGFQFKYFGFEWVRPFPEPFMSAFFALLALACLGIVLGKWYRISTLVFALGFTWSFLLEKTHYLNHGYFFCWIAFVMFFLPAHREWSLDAARKPSLRRKTIPFWSLAVLPFMMGVVYFYGGLAKINPDWLQAVPLKTWLSMKSGLPLIGPLLAKEGTAWFMAYGGLLLDLSIAFLLLFRKTRLWALGGALFFHLSNTIIFNIGIFPWLSLALTLLFFPPDLPRRWVSALRRWKPFDRWAERWNRRMESAPDAASWHDENRFKPYIKSLLILLVGFHLLYPLRHHALEGPVAWTEEGHRFSWRMMLRWKTGYGSFAVVDPKTGERQTVRPEDYLSKKQKRKLLTHPDMILQFAHFLRDKWCDEGKEDVQVFANIKAQLNGRPYQPFIDPETDLAQVEWSAWKASSWIVPLEMPEEEKSEEASPENE